MIEDRCSTMAYDGWNLLGGLRLLGDTRLSEVVPPVWQWPDQNFQHSIQNNLYIV